MNAHTDSQFQHKNLFFNSKTSIMDPIFFKALFGLHSNNPNPSENTAVVRTPPEINTSEGGEYLDDIIRMENPVTQYSESFDDQND